MARRKHAKKRHHTRRRKHAMHGIGGTIASAAYLVGGGVIAQFVGNMINKDWGRSYFVPNTFNSTTSVGLTKTGNLGGVATGDPIYTFKTPTTTPYVVDQFASRFQAQFGLRYSF